MSREAANAAACEELKALRALFQHNKERCARIDSILLALGA